jgi:hypothetical protein
VLLDTTSTTLGYTYLAGVAVDISLFPDACKILFSDISDVSTSGLRDTWAMPCIHGPFSCNCVSSIPSLNVALCCNCQPKFGEIDGC